MHFRLVCQLDGTERRAYRPTCSFICEIEHETANTFISAYIKISSQFGIKKNESNIVY